VVRPVDAYVVDLVLTIAQLHNTVDDAPRVGGQRGLRGLAGCRSADDGAGSLFIARRDLTGLFDVDGAPRLKATTFVDDSRTFAGCTMTCVAVIVVLSVVPSTSAISPLVTALDDAELVPFSYFVEDVSLTVTFWPVDVKRSNPDGRTWDHFLPESAVLGRPGSAARRSWCLTYCS
jgi:hypothetical protein